MKKYLALIIVVIALASGAYFTQEWFVNYSVEERVPQSSYTIPVTSTGTVLEVMSAFATSSDFEFSGRNFSGLGLLIEEIEGVGNKGGFYWTLFINNELSERGVSSAHVSPGDVVEWRYLDDISDY